MQKGDPHPCIVKLCVPELDRALEALAAQPRQFGHGGQTPQRAHAREPQTAREHRRVHRNARSIEGEGGERIAGDDKRLGLDERRSVSEQDLLLGKGRLDHRPLPGGLHVAQSPVDELCRAGRSARAEILRVDNQHPAAAACGIHGNSEARCPGADDDGVKVGRRAKRAEGRFTVLCVNGGCLALGGLGHGVQRLKKRKSPGESSAHRV